MRWLVDVTSLGRTASEPLHVEAETWQGALQAARASRGETASISGFSIEVLDEGCRALDGVSMLRYDVRPSARGTSKSRIPRARTSAPPRPASTPPASPPPQPKAERSASLVDADELPSWTEAEAAAPAPPEFTSAAAAPSSERGPPSTVPSQIIFKREQDRTSALPLTYREYVYVVPLGTAEAEAESLLETQLQLVQTSLEHLPSGKLVNLAAFDAQSRGKPQGLPVATLCWKDWKGASVQSFPRRGAQPTAQGAGALDAAVAADAPNPSLHLEPFSELPREGATENAAPVASSGHGSSPPRMAPTKGPRERVHGEELIADLFEAMHDLHFLRDAVDGGNFCLALGMDKIPSSAGIVHLYDINRREFVVTSTRGTGSSTLLLRRHPENDPMIARAMRLRRAVVIQDAAAGGAASIERYALLGGARSVIVAPVMQVGRFLGAIELLNPLDGRPFTGSDGNAMTYIAEQFAEFVATRGVVTDPERIGARRLAGA